MRSQRKDVLFKAMESLPFAVLLVQRGGRIAARNRRAEEMLPAGESLGQALSSSVDGTAALWEDASSELTGSSTPVTHHNLRVRSARGGSHLVDVHANLLDSEDGMCLLLVEDVTGRESMERRLAVSERLAGVGKLAAQVAHELNNPLDGILRYLGLAERACVLKDCGKVRRYMDEARKGVQRMADIVAELLMFSRAGGSSSETSPVSSLVDEAMNAMAPTLEAAGLTVVCDLRTDAPCTAPANFFQVLCNLMKNAADAITPPGRLTISTRASEEGLCITFADDGAGLPQGDPEQVFKPFYSTKSQGRGTGLGLSICRDIVERAGGTITAASRPEGGAVFTIRIPCRESARRFGVRSDAATSGEPHGE